MSIEKLWNDYELFFYHEFINSENFPQSKLDILRQDRGHYFIHNDFTIYQEKLYSNKEIDEHDYQVNYATFIVILVNLPITKIGDFLSFHYEKYNGEKKKFLEFVFYELKGSKTTRGGIEVDPPEQKKIAIDWCKMRLDKLDFDDKDKFNSKNKSYRRIKAKLIALNERIISLLKVHSTFPKDIFESLSNQFIGEIEKLKPKFTELQDFAPSNYAEFESPDGYFSWASKALISDIGFFINFLENIEPEDVEIDVSEEGIFLSGQNFDALLKFNEIISNAKSEIILIDNYLDESILEVLGSKNQKVKCKVLTLKRSLSKPLKIFIDAFNKQYKNLEVKTSSAFHDRFLILDQNDFYHFGASIKDAGNKGFMFSRIEESFIKQRLIEEFINEWDR